MALGVYQEDQRTGWLFFSWFILLGCIFFVLVSKYLSAKANRDFYLSKEHEDPDTRQKKARSAELWNKWINGTNWVGGSLFFVGALFVVLHIVTVR